MQVCLVRARLANISKVIFRIRKTKACFYWNNMLITFSNYLTIDVKSHTINIMRFVSTPLLLFSNNSWKRLENKNKI